MAIPSAETLALLLSAAIQGAATGKATRQGLAAAVAAALRTGAALLAPPTNAPGYEEQEDMDGEVTRWQREELAARVAAIQPTLANQILGRATSGAQRVRRNIATHVGFGEGEALLSQSTQELKRRQRGRRRPPPRSPRRDLPRCGRPAADS